MFTSIFQIIIRSQIAKWFSLRTQLACRRKGVDDDMIKSKRREREKEDESEKEIADTYGEGKPYQTGEKRE